MLPAPKRLEIDHRTLKLIVGVIALTLAGATWLFAGTDIESISASFWQGGWSQSFFVGSLFAVSAFLLAYNGFSRPEMILSKVAAVAGLGVALFPCGCEGHPEIAPPLHGPAGSRLAPAVHGLSAAVMFVILAYFCYGFFHRARAKGHSQAQARAAIYAICGVAILLSILALALHGLSPSRPGDRFTFYGEAAALIAFGISWLTASRVLPGVTRQDERFSPLADRDPPRD
jgi:hypothetical protein